MNKKSTNLPSITLNGDITVLGPMFDIHDNGEVNIYQSGRTEQPKPAKRKATEGKTKRATCDKPMTLKYYKHGNNSLLMKQRKRVLLVFQKLNEWGWLDERTAADDFDALFEGEPRHCNITWAGNATVLTILLQELLKQPYIEKQTGCSAKSMVERQFGRTANSGRSRLSIDDEDKIKLILLILDLRNPLPESRGRGNNDEPDMRDTALKAIFAGQLRTAKGV